jgi:hypothetical protein
MGGGFGYRLLSNKRRDPTMADEQNTQNGRVEYSEQELRERAAAFDQRFGSNAAELLNGKPGVDRELIDRTNEFLHRAGDRAAQDRVVEQIERQEYRERAAVSGGWVPGGASDEQRQELRADYQRRQDWNGLIEGGSVSASAQERSLQDLKPPAELTKREIVTEARELHAHFQQLMERFEQAPAGQKAEIRDEMKPLVTRENELREEYTGRVKAEISQDRVPEQSIGFGR